MLMLLLFLSALRRWPKQLGFWLLGPETAE
jgi:hypothetical protein